MKTEIVQFHCCSRTNKQLSRFDESIFEISFFCRNFSDWNLTVSSKCKLNVLITLLRIQTSDAMQYAIPSYLDNATFFLSILYSTSFVLYFSLLRWPVDRPSRLLYA